MENKNISTIDPKDLETIKTKIAKEKLLWIPELISLSLGGCLYICIIIILMI